MPWVEQGLGKNVREEQVAEFARFLFQSLHMVRETEPH